MSLRLVGFCTAILLVFIMGIFVTVGVGSPSADDQQLAGPVCVADGNTVRFDAGDSGRCSRGVMVSVAGLVTPDIRTSEGKRAAAALGRLVGGRPIICSAVQTTSKPSIEARCSNAAGQDITQAMAQQGWQTVHKGLLASLVDIFHF